MNDDRTEHEGWDRGDYALEGDPRSGFSGVEPGADHDWLEELDRVRQRLADLPSERERTPHERQVARDLRRREEALEAHLEKS